MKNREGFKLRGKCPKCGRRLWVHKKKVFCKNDGCGFAQESSKWLKRG